LEITGGETFLLKINVYETEKHVTLHSFYLWIQTIRTHAAKQMRWNASEAHKDYVNEEQNNKTQTLGKISRSWPKEKVWLSANFSKFFQALRGISSLLTYT